MTLACEDANSKLVEVATVAGDEDHVGNSFFSDLGAAGVSRAILSN